MVTLMASPRKAKVVGSRAKAVIAAEVARENAQSANTDRIAAEAAEKNSQKTLNDIQELYRFIDDKFRETYKDAVDAKSAAKSAEASTAEPKGGFWDYRLFFWAV